MTHRQRRTRSDENYNGVQFIPNVQIIKCDIKWTGKNGSLKIELDTVSVTASGF